MDLYQIKATIESIIVAIGKERSELVSLGKRMAKTESLYDKEIAIKMAILETGGEIKLDDVIIKSATATNLLKKAMGLCNTQLYEKKSADVGYKACLTNIKCLLAELNACQSLLRHFEEMEQ